MEQEGGGGDGSGGGEVVEEASPISSRPPANFEELMSFSAAGDDGRGGGTSSSSGNRWPREETLALLRIRFDMDSLFRDATLKAPLWEHVSRKLSELGYKRNAKKCKEKFENVQKYHKRTKEARGGRQDGKAYKFFSQLEALSTSTANATLDAAPLSVANPTQTPFSSAAASVTPFTIFPPPPPQYMTSFTSTPITPMAPPPAVATGATFSSHSSSTASGMGSGGGDDDDDMDVVDAVGPSSRKRKRGSDNNRKMREFFKGLVREVLQKQTAMQRSFLEALEKREQVRIDREEAWKRQELSRLARDHELMAQERAASASRDAAIVSLIQKITGHTIQLPPSLTHPPPQPAAKTPPPPPQHSRVAETSNVHHQSQLQPIMAIPEQQIPPPQQQQEKQEDQMGGNGSSEPAPSSRWPKVEVLTLINLRSGLEQRYQEAGPKGPLWEEISALMRRMGYNRSAKRCKEKWENINKYYKKVKESHKKRPEDAKTCPYFHRLDALYRDKAFSGSTGSGGVQHHGPDQDPTPTPFSASRTLESGSVQPNASASSSESPQEGAFMKGGEEKPEDIVKELMHQQEHTNIQQQEVVIGEYEKIEETHHRYSLEEDEDHEELDEDEKTAYEIAFQSNANRGSGGHAEPTFLTMVK